MTREPNDRASLGAGALIAVGLLVLGSSMACSSESSRDAVETPGVAPLEGGADSAKGTGVAAQGTTAGDLSGSVEETPSDSSDSETAAETEPNDAVVGRAFSDLTPVVDDGGAPPVLVLDGFDPSYFTEEALAKNPLSIGTQKRAPFQLAEGADPLDPASYDWTQDKDGHWIISYYDLSLEDVDKDLLLDALVYPEEYEGEDIQFPDRIRALDGKKVALTGYMIAMRWKKDKLTHFMLVRDLKSCCFGQQPEPDEWVDVPMQGAGAPYIQYVPVITRGIFRLTGSSDPAGYAVGAFQIEATDVREE